MITFIEKIVEMSTLRRIRNSKKKVEHFNSIAVTEQAVNHKPKGLWYGLNDSWLEWCKHNQPNWIYPYLHEIIVDEDKLLTLSTIDETLKFHEKYGVQESKRTECIDWRKVAEDYSGIEIYPYYHKLEFDIQFFFLSPWYISFDTESGCIWNEDAVKEIRLIAKIK